MSDHRERPVHRFGGGWQRVHRVRQAARGPAARPAYGRLKSSPKWWTACPDFVVCRRCWFRSGNCSTRLVVVTRPSMSESCSSGMQRVLRRTGDISSGPTNSSTWRAKWLGSAASVRAPGCSFWQAAAVGIHWSSRPRRRSPRCLSATLAKVCSTTTGSASYEVNAWPRRRSICSSAGSEARAWTARSTTSTSDSSGTGRPPWTCQPWATGSSPSARGYG